MHLNPYSRNAPDLSGNVLYATDRPEQMLELMAAHPERRPYLELTSDPALADAFHHPYPDVPTVSMVPFRCCGARVHGPGARHRARSGPLVAQLPSR